MGRTFGIHDGRLSGHLTARLDPALRDALAHPIRREVLRTLNRSSQPRGVAEIKAELRTFRLSELSYHLLVLQRSRTVFSMPARGKLNRDRARYVSEVEGDGRVRAVLQATERGDREQREAAAAADTSPLLTMFRVPKPVRTIRLRSRRKIDAERER